MNSPIYTFILSIISWMVFLMLILPGPFKFSNIGAYSLFTMGIFPGLLVIAVIQMIKLKFQNVYGWLTFLSCLIAEYMLLLFVYSDW